MSKKNLTDNWTYQPPERTKWVETEASRIGVTPSAVEKAFAPEFAEKKDLFEPLEIPDVMRITYKYTYGGQSPFFRALRDYGKLLGAKCAKCDFTYCPPRKNCSRCYGETEWIELPGTGVIESFTTIYKGTSMITGRTPVVCAYIRLDKTDFVTLSNVEMDDPSKAVVGMKVKAVFKKERVGRVTDFYFEEVK
ncbi:MAG TPA: Zn-ribbon domain-containing OB-fold protein [Bdellovibrionales bacterium]|nr:Zn-ribbon domain-containing OB-fold protein [Bdellovibrionales bacterium]